MSDSTAAPISIGANKRVNLKDVVRVAVYGQQVIASDLTVTDSTVKSATSASSIDPADFVTRAGAFCRIAAAAQSKSLVDALAPPAVAATAPESDVATAKHPIVGVADALNANSLGQKNSLDKLIADIFPGGHGQKLFDGQPFLEVGAGSLLAAAAQSVVAVVDCITALSCEALGGSYCSQDTFDAQMYEVCRPHRGQMQSAANLRLMLDGSKRLSTTAATVVGSNDHSRAVQTSPQSTGPCRDIIAAASKAMEIELNSVETIAAVSAGKNNNSSSNSSSSNNSSGSAVSSAQARLTSLLLLNSLETLVAASQQRVAAMQSQLTATTATTTATTADVPPLPAAAVAVATDGSAQSLNSIIAAVNRVTAQLNSEAALALRLLDDIEAAEVAKKLQAMSVKDTTATTTAATTAAMGKPEVDDSKLTAEQRAKAEAKRKAKADKAAEKAKAKEQQKKGLVLGAGSTLLRAHLVTTSAASTASTTSTTASAAAVFDAFDLSESSLSAFCVQLLEQLSSGGGKYKPKIAKGARDFGPEQMRIREQAFAAIRRVFKRHGGVEIDTPVFELKDLLTGKYGEDSKLIYDLADQGGELLSLRYDLTVPFARFLAMNSVGNIKRYHIAKVYRRDQPQPARGRFREFYQCDFDVAGVFAPMAADAEVITVATEILNCLPVGDFIIKINHRQLLDAIFEICGVPLEKFRPICSAVDKLDKMSWELVRQEMVEEKGLAAEAADKIAGFVLLSGKPMELWERLTASQQFGKHVKAEAAMADMRTLFQYLEAMGSLQHVSFDMSLARGLDYYTGVIYEAVLVDGAAAVGSIAAGGRYDNLVGMFSSNSSSNNNSSSSGGASGVQTPCVGVSIGIERVFAIMERKAQQQKLLQATNIQVYIASIGANLMSERMKVAKLLWDANFSAEYSHQDNPKFKKQLDDALERGIGFMVVFGQDELDSGVLKLKNMAQHSELQVPRQQLVAALLEQGLLPIPSGGDMKFLEQLKEGK